MTENERIAKLTKFQLTCLAEDTANEAVRNLTRASHLYAKAGDMTRANSLLIYADNVKAVTE